MPKSMVKKEINKLTKVIHPKSRKTAAISKNMKKATSREKTKLVHHMKNNLLGEKILWFRDNADPTAAEYTPEMLRSLVEAYLARNDEELAQIHLKHSIGNRSSQKRQHASREDILKLLKLGEEEEFETCGIELPDMLDAKQLTVLRMWNGELRFLQNFTLRRYNRSSLIDKSSHDVQRGTD